MEHKKRKGAYASFVFLALAMVSLIGVGFAALNYTGSATNTDNEATSEMITVTLDDYNGFISGAYTVNTVNNGTDISVSSLKKDGTSMTSYTSKYFKYSEGAFTLADSDNGYSAAEIGSVTVTVSQTEDATATNVDLAISGCPTAVTNQYGISLVYVCDNAVFTPASGVQDLDMTSGPVSVTIKAYAVYNNSIPLANAGNVSAFTISDSDITFTATAQTV